MSHLLSIVATYKAERLGVGKDIEQSCVSILQSVQKELRLFL